MSVPLNTPMPFDAWALSPSFKPKKVTLVGKWWASHFHDDKKKMYHPGRDLWPTLQEAIAGGHQRLDLLEERISKQQASIAKRRAELFKATA